MSSSRLTARDRRARLLVSRLEDRTVPTQLRVDPALNMAGAVAELRDAITTPPADNLVTLFGGGVYVFTDTINGDALPTINQWGTTKSPTAVGFTLDGNGATLRRSATAGTPDFRFVTISGTSNGYARAVVSNLTLDNGSAAGAGGAVRVVSNPADFVGVRFTNNKATGSGGAVAFVNSNFDRWQTTFAGCTFQGNAAAGGGTEGGGAVALSEGAGSFLTENTTNYVITQSQFTDNKATGGDGGALLSRDDDFLVSGSSFVSNTAFNNGGAVLITSDAYRTNGTPGNDVGNTRGFIDNSTIFGNTAKRGGGVYLDGGWTDLRFFNDTVNRNTATAVGGGGGIHWEQSATTPEDILVGIQRFNGIFVRAELSYTVVAENTSPSPSFADLRGWFFDATTPTQNTIQVGNLRGYGTNFVGVLEPGVTLFNTDSSQQASFVGSGTKTAPADPQLAVTVVGGVAVPRLQDNGGGLLTRPPRANSPLLDRGPNVVYQDLESTPGNRATTDQRGGNFARVARGTSRLDIGAVEVQDPGSVALIKVAGDNQTTATRAAFGTPVVLRTVDRFGDPLAGQVVTAGLLTGSAGATFPLADKVTTDAFGYATFYPVGNKVEATYQQPFQVGGDTAIFTLTNRSRLNFTSTDFTTTPAPASGSGQATVVNTAFATPLTVQVTRLAGTDANGNPLYAPVPGVTVSFLATSTAGNGSVNPAVLFTSGNPQTGAGYATAVTDSNGYASVTAKANTKASQVNAVTVLASANGFGANGVPTAAGAVTLVLTNLPGATTKLTYLFNDQDGLQSGNRQSALVPNTFGNQLAVLAGDDFGNPAGGQVVTFASDPANTARATFPFGSTATTGTDGIARVTARAAGTAGTYAVTATAAGLAPQVFTLTNLPGLPAAVTPLGGNNQQARVTDVAVSSGTAGAFPVPLTVEVRDTGGNLVPGAAVTFQGPGVGAGARLEPVVVTTDAAGRATVFAVPNSVSGAYQVSASVQSGASTFVTATFNLVNLPGGPAGVRLESGGGQSARTGEGFTSDLLVRVLDQFQNPVPGVTPTVTGSGVSGTATVSGADGLSVIRVTAGTTVGPAGLTVGVGAGTLAVPFTVLAQPFPPPTATTGVPTLTAVGLDGGIASRVTVYNPDGSVRTQFAPFDPGFLGGARTAVARAPLPESPKVVVVPGPGRFPDARVFSADDGTELASFQPFEQTFTGGLYVASADVDRDGWDDYVFSPDQGGGPRVQIRSGRTGEVLQDFFGIDDPNFRGGARTALADLTGDGRPELIVAAGFGGGPRIAVYDGASLVGFRAVPQKLVGDFFAFEPGLRNGAFVAAGDVTGDKLADVVLGGGPGGGPRVRVLNGAELLAGRQTVVSDFFAGPSTDRGGVRVTVRDLDADAQNDIVTASGSGAGSRVSVYLGKDLRVGQPLAARGFDDLPGFAGGVFVG